jgi:hypothetical protein
MLPFLLGLFTLEITLYSIFAMREGIFEFFERQKLILIERIDNFRIQWQSATEQTGGNQNFNWQICAINIIAIMTFLYLHTHILTTKYVDYYVI